MSMALSTEDIFGIFNLDSGDTEKISAKQIGDIQESPLISAITESENCCYNSSCEEVTKQTSVKLINDKISEKNSSAKLECNACTTSLLSDGTDEKASLLKNKETFSNSNDIPDIVASTDASAKSRKKQIGKINKRVHFNTQVETFIFEPTQSINENYNYTEEFSVENVFTNAFSEKRIRWKSESNLAIRNPRPCSQCSIMEEWLKCDRHFHQLKKGYPMPEYSRLDDEDITDTPKKELWPRLKRTSSCFFRKKNNENENGSSDSSPGNLNRRLSISVRNLKMETKSLIDTFWTKVTKKKEEICPTHDDSMAGDVIHMSEEEIKDKHSPTKMMNSIFGKKKSEDANGSPKGNIHLRAWKSVQNLNKKKNLPASKFYLENSMYDFADEPCKLKKKSNLFRKRACEGENGSPNAVDQNGTANAVPGNFGLRSWKSVQNLKLDSKSWVDKFVTKVMKI